MEDMCNKLLSLRKQEIEIRSKISLNFPMSLLKRIVKSEENAILNQENNYCNSYSILEMLEYKKFKNIYFEMNFDEKRNVLEIFDKLTEIETEKEELFLANKELLEKNYYNLNNILGPKILFNLLYYVDFKSLVYKTSNEFRNILMKCDIQNHLLFLELDKSKKNQLLRIISNKACIAAKLDYFGSKKIDFLSEIKIFFKEKVEPKKDEKPLPIPIKPPKRQRGGRKFRKIKNKIKKRIEYSTRQLNKDEFDL
ncbi:hypothetical protein CWI36_0044p0080 [Hamiltosporidium magnivora]|uniref:Prp31 C-terminal domain-containing protein n=1 Tax=Hamiltosporidium magnivora TaxID=148818 RepID=A0A4V2JWU1_9MICR|nr:hypothetical protein CWI36_0044p0080 [Hamiltosporidium magnivora]